MPKGFEEHDSNVLAKEIVTNREMREFIEQDRASQTGK